MMQTNSPRAIDSHTSSNTVVLPPPGAGKRLLTPSSEMNLSLMGAAATSRARCAPSPCSRGEVTEGLSALIICSLRKRHQLRCAREDLVERHADDADHQDRSDHVGD